MSDQPLPKTKACGILLYKQTPQTRILLMRHADRWDLPKGHIEPGEDELACALRETEEETGLSSDAIELDPDFCFREVYYPRYKRTKFQPVEKTLVVFLGRVAADAQIRPTEHLGFEWLPWSPPHQIQTFTIDPLLAALQQHWAHS